MSKKDYRSQCVGGLQTGAGQETNRCSSFLLFPFYSVWDPNTRILLPTIKVARPS